jgi:hypothetical protein
VKNNKSFFKSLVLTILLLTLPPGCAEELEDVVPDVPVNVFLQLIHYNLSPASAMIVTNQMVSASSLGYDNNGLVVYRDISEFYAYDRTCPYHVEKSIPVVLSANPLYAECSVCGSRFQLWFNGFPADSSPSKYPLKQYQTTYYPNSNTLHIYN